MVTDNCRHFQTVIHRCETCNAAYTDPARLSRCRKAHRGRYRCPVDGCQHLYAVLGVHPSGHRANRDACRNKRLDGIRAHLRTKHRHPDYRTCEVYFEEFPGIGAPNLPLPNLSVPGPSANAPVAHAQNLQEHQPPAQDH